MKIQVNSLMKKLIEESKVSIGEVQPINKYAQRDIFENGVLEPIEGGENNYLYGNIDILSLKTKRVKVSNYKVYFNSIRIDNFYLGSDICIDLYNYSIALGSSWLFRLKNDYPKDNFILSIQYDEGDSTEGICQGMFVKCFHKQDFLTGYLTTDAESFSRPYVIIEV